PVAGREVVEHTDVVAALEQPADEVRADEPCAAGDEHLRHREAIVVTGTVGRPRVRRILDWQRAGCASAATLACARLRAQATGRAVCAPRRRRATAAVSVAMPCGAIGAGSA